MLFGAIWRNITREGKEIYVWQMMGFYIPMANILQGMAAQHMAQKTHLYKNSLPWQWIVGLN